jgi:uroporphyrinogen decarboxylase
MNSKERFKAACEFKNLRRPPVDYIAHKLTDEKLKRHIGADTEVQLLDYLGSNFYYLSCRDISQNEGFMKCYKHKLDVNETERTCSLGIRWIRGAYDHKFCVDEATKGPLENISSKQEILSYKWPKPSDFDFSTLFDECEMNAQRVIVGGLWTGIMGDSYRMYGFEKFLLDMAMRPEFIKTLVDKITEVYLKLNDYYFSTLKGKMDVWFFGNDFGSQNGLLLSPEMWYRFFYDNIKKLTSLAHSYNLKVMAHSCGSISEIIPYLIKAGVDILDPIQVTAKGMEPETLAKKFGGKIVFHGGNDTQHVLPESSTEQVREHALYNIRTFGRNGGYIFAPSQLLGPDIPVENILAMYNAVRDS